MNKQILPIIISVKLIIFGSINYADNGLHLIKRNTRLAWILLLCFIAGQYVAFFHQHKGNTHAFSYSISKNSSNQTLSEKCSICDQMHHTQMALFHDAVPMVAVAPVETIYDRQHDYKGIALILAAGRGPPSVPSC